MSSLLSKMKKKTDERRVRSNHPILKMNLDREVRDAYFEGMIFATVADDETVDDAERAYLEKVAISLGIPGEEVGERIKSFADADSNGKIALGEELADALKGSGVADVLLCEFSLVWAANNHEATELDDFRKQFAEWMEASYDEKLFALFDEVSAKVKEDATVVYALRDYLDDDVIRYLFADVFEIEKIFAQKREEEDRAVPPHPLKAILDDAQKARYLNMICAAVNETSDNAPTKLQQKGLRHLAIALGVKDADAATEEKEIALSPDSAMRSLAFFRYCDMARLFAMDGCSTFSAAQNQALDGIVTEFKLVPEDAAFLREYTAFYGNEKEPDAAVVVQKAQRSIRFPDGFIRYFTPNMKPIVLAGGDTPDDVYQIVDGHYRLEKTLKVGDKTRLVIKNAVIDFAPEARIELNNCMTEISDSEFNGEKGEDEKKMGIPFFSGNSDNEVKFERCCFNGAEWRAAVRVAGTATTIILCKLNRLRGSAEDSIMGILNRSAVTSSLHCSHSQWNDCKASACFIEGQNINFEACDFVNCNAETFIQYHDFEDQCSIRVCLFDGCRCNNTFQIKDSQIKDSPLSVLYIFNGDFECNYVSSSVGFSTITQSNLSLEQLHKARVAMDKG